MTNTIKFAEFPFTHQGVEFVSKIAETSRYLPQILNMGEDFINMNKVAIDEIIPDLVSIGLNELNERIAIINDGGSEMFLELAPTIGGND